MYRNKPESRLSTESKLFKTKTSAVAKGSRIALLENKVIDLYYYFYQFTCHGELLFVLLKVESVSTLPFSSRSIDSLLRNENIYITKG